MFLEGDMKNIQGCGKDSDSNTKTMVHVMKNGAEERCHKDLRERKRGEKDDLTKADTELIN